jgi:hypothetical protein
MISDEVLGIALVSPSLAMEGYVLLSATISHDLVIVGYINTEKHRGDEEERKRDHVNLFLE